MKSMYKKNIIYIIIMNNNKFELDLTRNSIIDIDEN